MCCACRLKKSDTSHPLSLTSEDLYASLLEKMTRKFNDALVLLKMGVPEVDKWRQHMLQVLRGTLARPPTDT